MNHHINPVVAKTIVCAIIEQAIADYRGLEEGGIVVKGNPAPTRGPRIRKMHGYVHHSDIKELCDFFQPGGGLEILLSVADVPIHAERVREKLKICQTNA